MSASRQNRRDFLKTSAVAAAAASTPFWFSLEGARAFSGANERPRMGCIGVGDRWKAVGRNAFEFADCLAVCDVDRNHAEESQKIAQEARAKKGVEAKVDLFEDYRKILDNKDIDVVTIVTPDHWHSKIAIEAMQAGKDVYCEKPLTLTIHEGKQIIKVLNETKRVFQVGTQQRSEMGSRFLTAAGLVHDGRIGKVKKVQCAIGGAPTSDAIPEVPVPEGLNWDLWLGQTPVVPFRFQEVEKYKYGKSRCHYEFRWWYEYSGGKMTDWGAHHVDVAQWAIGMDDTGPLSVEGTAKHPVEFKDGFPTQSDRYNAASEFYVTCKFPKDIEVVIRHDTENGITFEGTEGTFFVSRRELKGEAVDSLKTKPLPEEVLKKLTKGRIPRDNDGNAHMRNFFDCVVDRSMPRSDVWSHHRAMTTCHLANIAIRTGRKLEWDAKAEQITNDKLANSMLQREQRKGFEINVTV